MMIRHEDVKPAVFLSVDVLLLGVTIVTRDKLLEIYTTIMRPSDSDDDHYLACYQRRHREMQRASKGESKAKTWFYKLCNGDREPNTHELLFWCGLSGSGLVLHIIRTCLFLAVVYLSVMVFKFGGDLTHGSHTMKLMGLALVCPGIMMYRFMPQVTKLYILCSSIEMMRRRHIIHEVEHDIRKQRRFSVRTSCMRRSSPAPFTS